MTFWCIPLFAVIYSIGDCVSPVRHPMIGQIALSVSSLAIPGIRGHGGREGVLGRSAAEQPNLHNGQAGKTTNVKGKEHLSMSPSSL